MKSRLIGKDSELRLGGQEEEEGVTGGMMVQWHHQLMDMSLLDGSLEIVKTGKSVLQSMGLQKKSDTSEGLNNNKDIYLKLNTS